jgi:hypothetical protein
MDAAEIEASQSLMIRIWPDLPVDSLATFEGDGVTGIDMQTGGVLVVPEGVNDTVIEEMVGHLYCSFQSGKDLLT